jgi:DNA helicase HerA-like ATPase
MDIRIGRRTSDGRPEGLGRADLLRHLYVLGKTGSGKSTALLRVLEGWLEGGDGCALVDPHGDLAGDFLRSIPPYRVSDVVMIDPSDRSRPLAWNPLWRVAPERRPAAAQGLVSAFRGVWRDSWGPRMEYILVNALRLLLDAEEESLLGLPRLLSDAAYRRCLEGRCLDPVVAAFWRTEFGAWDRRFRTEAVAPIQNKVGQFLGDPLMRSVLGQRRSRLDLRLSMDRGRILVASLSKGLVGEQTASLFGALLVASLHEAALSRADLPEAGRRPFLLAVDEFQGVATDRFSSALSEARKYGLGLVLSHQFLGQLLPEVRDAALGNAGSMLLFRMGGGDAAEFSRELGREWPPSRLADLPPYEAVLYSPADGGPPVGRIIKTDAPDGALRGDGEVAAIRRRSGERFGTDGARVEERIARWMGRRF